jgi:hypothetical protein
MFRLMLLHIYQSFFNLYIFPFCSLNKWNAELIMPREKQTCLKSNWTILRTNSKRFAMFNLICLIRVTFMFLFLVGYLSLLYIMNHDSYFQCLHQKTEAEKKLATFSSQEVSSTGSDVLVKQLQQELQHYVSLLCLLSWVSVPLDLLIVCVRLHTLII